VSLRGTSCPRMLLHSALVLLLSACGRAARADAPGADAYKGGAAPAGYDGYLDVDMDAPMPNAEMDALTQAAGAERLKGMDVVGRKVAPDGKSGMLQFGNPNAEREQWTPQHVVSHRELLHKIENENIVLAYFFSSAEDELGTSHQNGKIVEEAAQQLLEHEEEVPLVMVDFNRMDKEDAAADFGITRPQQFVLFMGSKPMPYTGPTDAKGIVGYMTARSGAAVHKLTTAAALDAVLDDAAAAAVTVVVGAFRAGYEGGTAKTSFYTKATEMRDPSRLRFVETTFKTANAAKRLAERPPFDGYQSAYVVLPPASWLGKSEAAYHLSSDFRKLFSFISSHAWPVVMPMSEAYRKHASRGLKKHLLAVLLYDTKRHASKHRYILKQLHKLIASDPALADLYAFAVGERFPLDPYLVDRFERTTIPWIEDEKRPGVPKFYSDFANDYPMEQFTLIVANMTTEENWMDVTSAGAMPEGFDSLRLARMLQNIASFSEKPLPQKEAAATAAGLQEMSLGFGGEGTMEQKMSGGPRKLNNPNKKKKKRKKKFKERAVPHDEV